MVNFPKLRRKMSRRLNWENLRLERRIPWSEIRRRSKLLLWCFSIKSSFDCVQILLDFWEFLSMDCFKLLEILLSLKYFEAKFTRGVSIRVVLLILLVFLLFLLIRVNHVFIWTIVLIIWLFLIMLDCGRDRIFMGTRNGRDTSKSWSVRDRNINSTIIVLWLSWVKLICDYLWTWTIKIRRILSMICFELILSRGSCIP